MTPSGLPALLRQLADYADVRGALADAGEWRRLAADLERAMLADEAAYVDLARTDRLGEIAGLTPALRRRLQRLLAAGADVHLTLARGELPWLVRRLLDLGAIDPADASVLSRLGIVTFSDLRLAMQDGRLPRTMALAARLEHACSAEALDPPLLTLGRAIDFAESLTASLAATCPEISRLILAGDIRRFEAHVEAIVVVGCAADPSAAIDSVCSLPIVQRTLHRTGRRALVGFHGTEVDLRIAAPDEYGTTLFLATGSSDHIAALRSRQRGIRLCAREEELYTGSGLDWIPPELRQGTGEIQAAETGSLPALVTREHVRGDLHMHTTYSDGRDTLVEMVQAAAALGYEYVAITDHSARAGAARTVTLDALSRQRDEIAALRERVPSLAILHGIEVDIMPDGRLDFADGVLETLDIVLASLHDGAGHGPARLTRRCLAAIEHPLVNVITHPANRLVGRHAGYNLDFDAVYHAAAATGTALEIDGAPSHLDLDGARARQAVAAGVTVAIDSDCHRATLLGRQMTLGIGTARRGWVEPRHVLNTRPIDEVRAFVARKRRARR